MVASPSTLTTTNQKSSARTLFVFALLFAAAPAGCKTPAESPACTVAGKLLVNDRPAQGAYIRFHHLDDADAILLPDAARCEEDGSFSVVVRQPGKYAITVMWPSVTLVDGEEYEGDDRLNGRFNNPARPPERIEITEKQQALPPIKLYGRVASG